MLVRRRVATRHDICVEAKRAGIVLTSNSLHQQQQVQEETASEEARGIFNLPAVLEAGCRRLPSEYEPRGRECYLRQSRRVDIEQLHRIELREYSWLRVAGKE